MTECQSAASTPRSTLAMGSLRRHRPLPGAVFDAHCHLDAMAQRAGVEATREFVADVLAGRPRWASPR